MSCLWKKSKRVRIPWIIKQFQIQPCCQRGPLVGLPGILNLGLIPLQKTRKILKKISPEDMSMHSVLPTQEICLSIQIALASNWNNFTNFNALLDSGANAIFIDKAWAEKHKVLLMPLWDPIPVYNVDRTCNSTFWKRNLSTCHFRNHGIMQLISRTYLSQRMATLSLYLQWSNKRLWCSLMTN